jgi:hypothetical protein
MYCGLSLTQSIAVSEQQDLAESSGTNIARNSYQEQTTNDRFKHISAPLRGTDLGSYLGLLSNFQRVIHLDTQILERTFRFRMAK